MSLAVEGNKNVATTGAGDPVGNVPREPPAPQVVASVTPPMPQAVAVSSPSAVLKKLPTHPIPAEAVTHLSAAPDTAAVIVKKSIVATLANPVRSLGQLTPVGTAPPTKQGPTTVIGQMGPRPLLQHPMEPKKTMIPAGVRPGLVQTQPSTMTIASIAEQQTQQHIVQHHPAPIGASDAHIRMIQMPQLPQSPLRQSSLTSVQRPVTSTTSIRLPQSPVRQHQLPQLPVGATTQRLIAQPGVTRHVIVSSAGAVTTNQRHLAMLPQTPTAPPAHQQHPHSNLLPTVPSSIMPFNPSSLVPQHLNSSPAMSLSGNVAKLNNYQHLLANAKPVVQPRMPKQARIRHRNTSREE